MKDTDNSAPPEKSSSSDEETKMSDSSPAKSKEKSDEDVSDSPLKIEGFGKANDTPAHLKEYTDEGASPVSKLPVTRINKNAAEACKRLSFSLT